MADNLAIARMLTNCERCQKVRGQRSEAQETEEVFAVVDHVRVPGGSGPRGPRRARSGAWTRKAGAAAGIFLGDLLLERGLQIDQLEAARDSGSVGATMS